MTPEKLHALLDALANGRTSVAEAERALSAAPYEDLGFARVDHHRALVQGTPEVVYGEGKTPAEVVAIVRSLLDRGANALVTRANDAQAAAVRVVAPDVVWNERGRVLAIARTAPARLGSAAVVCAGTTDLPVLEECEACAVAFGIEAHRFVDVGDAGLHRLLAVRERIDAHDVVIVVAGMEGALASVVGGLTRKPVIAVPTSVGYGVAAGGVAALHAMLSSCSSGITVVNIDNGFGAAMAARRILAATGAR
jgi:hypothetical protein